MNFSRGRTLRFILLITLTLCTINTANCNTANSTETTHNTTHAPTTAATTAAATTLPVIDSADLTERVEIILPDNSEEIESIHSTDSTQAHMKKSHYNSTTHTTLNTNITTTTTSTTSTCTYLIAGALSLLSFSGVLYYFWSRDRSHQRLLLQQKLANDLFTRPLLQQSTKCNARLQGLNWCSESLEKDEEGDLAHGFISVSRGKNNNTTDKSTNSSSGGSIGFTDQQVRALFIENSLNENIRDSIETAEILELSLREYENKQQNTTRATTSSTSSSSKSKKSKAT